MLTERMVRDAKSTGKAYTIWDGQVKGLGLQVTQAGKRNYVLRYTTDDGRKRQAIICRAGEVSLKTIRERAGLELLKIRNGEADPLERKRESRAAPTINDLLEQFFNEIVPRRAEEGRLSPVTITNYGAKPGGTSGRCLGPFRWRR